MHIEVLDRHSFRQQHADVSNQVFLQSDKKTENLSVYCQLDMADLTLHRVLLGLQGAKTSKVNKKKML